MAGSRDMRNFAARLKKMGSQTIANKIAENASAELTTAIQASFDAGEDVYGSTRKVGVHGDALDLVASGSTRNWLQFSAVGNLIRCRLGTPYAKYLIGKYRIVPIGASALPAAWLRILLEQVHKTMEATQ